MPTSDRPPSDRRSPAAERRRTGVAGFLRHEAGAQWAEIQIEYVRPDGAVQPGLICVSTRSSDGRAWHGCTLTIAEGEEVVAALGRALEQARGGDATDRSPAS